MNKINPFHRNLVGRGCVRAVTLFAFQFKAGRIRCGRSAWVAALTSQLTCALCVAMATLALCGFSSLASTASSLAVMANTNGVLIAPTNFWATNASAISSAIGGGSGGNPSETNLIASGSTYSASVDANATSQFGVNVYYKWITLNTNITYYIAVPGSGTGNDFGVFWDTNSYNGGTQVSGLFTPTNAVCEIVGGSASSVIGAQIYPAYTNIYGYLGGQFSGTLTTNSFVPTPCLDTDVLKANHQITGGNLFCKTTNTVEHWIAQQGAADGSTLGLFKAGPTGYCDLGFYAQSSSAIPSLATQPAANLFFAIGVGVPGASQFPYNQPFIESYGDNYAIYYVGASHIYGGFKPGLSALGHWIWYRANTNDMMMDVNPDVAATLFNYPISENTNISTPTITITNAPTLQSTNALPGDVTISSGVISTAPTLWLTITNNGNVYSIPVWK